MESSASTSTRVSSSSESLTSYSRASTTDRNMRSWRRLSSSRFMPRASAVSFTFGTRPSSVARRCSTASSLRARVRTERGAQSAARTASRIAPRMRWAAKRSNGHPPGLVVAASRLDQAEGAGGGQLLAVDVAWEVHRHLEHHVAHQRQVLLDERMQLSFVPLDRRCHRHLPESCPDRALLRYAGPPVEENVVQMSRSAQGSKLRPLKFEHCRC